MEASHKNEFLIIRIMRMLGNKTSIKNIFKRLMDRLKKIISNSPLACFNLLVVLIMWTGNH